MKSIAYSSFFYYLVRTLMWPFSWLPHRAIHATGRFLGSVFYYLGPKKLRKITYNNLALAQALNLSESEILRISKESYQNLTINCLEYFRIKRSRHKIDSFVQVKNSEVMHQLIEGGQGVICVTGHISNWELCFLHHTQKWPGVAIGKVIKNKKLYDFILSIRQMHGGTVIPMKNAISSGLQYLQKGVTFSMVNDQAYTSSSYSYPFLGARAWTSAAPALAAYRANAPIFAVKTKRMGNAQYEYTLSAPIWPDVSKPLKQEVTRMMDEIMKNLERYVQESPGQWLWQHKRWKQEGYNYIYHEYKADSLLIVLPEDSKLFDWINRGIWIIEQIYTRSFLTFMIPEKYKGTFWKSKHEVLTYNTIDDICIRDYRFQLIMDLTNQPSIGRHFLKLGAHKVYDFNLLISRSADFDLESLTPSFDIFLSRILCMEQAKFIPPQTV